MEFAKCLEWAEKDFGGFKSNRSRKRSYKDYVKTLQPQGVVMILKCEHLVLKLGF